MAIQDFTAGQVLTAAQMDNLQANDYNQTVSTKTANYVLVAADKGTRVVMNAAGATTITVNDSLFSAGDTLYLQNIGAGVTTVTAGTATVSSAGPLAIPQYGSGTLYFTSAGVAIYFPSAVTIPPASSGLVFIAGGTITDTTSVNNCFSATYLNYKVVFSNLVSGDASAVKLRMRASGTDNSSSLYSYANFGQNTSTGSETNLGVGRDTNSFSLGYGNNYTNSQSLSIDFFSPQAAKNTHYGPGVFWNDETNYAGFIAGIHKSTTSFDGFTIFPTSSTLAGSYKVYGYANS
jgi:hypothetical protein